MTHRPTLPLARALAGVALTLPLFCLTPSNAWAATEVVTHTQDNGVGSLRAAIEAANLNPGTTIQFKIPPADPGFGGGVARIKPTSALPAITADGTVIDGTSQMANAGDTNPNGPEVELDGSTSGLADGLTIEAASCTVKGLVVTHFGANGIQIWGLGAKSNKVQGCYLGIAANGTDPASNGYSGVLITGTASSNLIGGTRFGEGNLISGNAVCGVEIAAPGADSNVVQGNLIGTTISGNLPAPNQFAGVAIAWGPKMNTIGGLTPSARNVISANLSVGVWMYGAGTEVNHIAGNYIGTDRSGTQPLGNGAGSPNAAGSGVVLFDGAAGNTVQGNVISGNVRDGVTVRNGVAAGTESIYNTISGNYVGTDAAGAVWIPNGLDGLRIESSSTMILGNVVVGSASDANSGIHLESNRNVLEGNHVGTDPTGSFAVEPGYRGIRVLGAGNRIGGLKPSHRNIISGSQACGLEIVGPYAVSNRVLGNYIGLDETGKLELGNQDGVVVRTAQMNVIGSTSPGGQGGSVIG